MRSAATYMMVEDERSFAKELVAGIIKITK
jgi:hypothetical protein